MWRWQNFVAIAPAQPVLLQPRLPIEDLTGEPQIVVKGSHAAGVIIGSVCAERIREPRPHRDIIGRAGDLARGIQLVGDHVVNRDARATGP